MSFEDFGLGVFFVRRKFFKEFVVLVLMRESEGKEDDVLSEDDKDLAYHEKKARESEARMKIGKD